MHSTSQRATLAIVLSHLMGICSPEEEHYFIVPTWQVQQNNVSNDSYESQDVWHCCSHSYTATGSFGPVGWLVVAVMVVLTDLRVAKGKQNFIEIHCANFPRMLQLERKLVSHFLSSSINIPSFCSRQYIFMKQAMLAALRIQQRVTLSLSL